MNVVEKRPLADVSLVEIQRELMERNMTMAPLEILNPAQRALLQKAFEAEGETRVAAVLAEERGIAVAITTEV